MPNTNVVSPSSHYGASDTVRHGFTPARRETFDEWSRRFMGQQPHYQYELARLRGEVTYTKKS